MASFTTPFSNIRYIGIYENSSAKELSVVKSEQGAHGICNGTFFDTSTFKPNSNALWINGTMKNRGYHWGYNLGTTISLSDHMTSHSGDFIGGFPTYRNGALASEPNCPPGATKRVAIGAKGSNFVFYHAESFTLNQVEMTLRSLTLDSAVMLDGGDSSQFNFGSRITQVTSARKVPNFLVFYFKDQAMPTISQGLVGPVVSYMQKLLNNQGWSLTVNGNFNTTTTNALKSFQAEKGRPQTGSCDPTTWSLLGA